MRSAMKLMGAGCVGAVLGAAGISALNAQTATPQAYLIANIQEVKNPDTYRQYQTQVSATHVPFGGHFLARGAKAVMLDNSAEPKGTLVILAFPSMKNLRDWWNSTAYAAIKPIREANTVMQLYAIEGVTP